MISPLINNKINYSRSDIEVFKTKIKRGSDKIYLLHSVKNQLVLHKDFFQIFNNDERQELSLFLRSEPTIECRVQNIDVCDYNYIAILSVEFTDFFSIECYMETGLGEIKYQYLAT